MYTNLNNCDFTPKEEIEKRIENLKKSMAKAGIDYAVILQNVDLFYFTGTIQKGVLIVPVDQSPLFFVEKSVCRADLESPLEIIPIKKDKDVGNFVSGKNVIKGRGGMEIDVLPVTLFERWKSILDHENIADVSPLIKELRLIKVNLKLHKSLSQENLSRMYLRKQKPLSGKECGRST
jgi:Xaa-Pro aminopeptidase